MKTSMRSAAALVAAAWLSTGCPGSDTVSGPPSATRTQVPVRVTSTPTPNPANAIFGGRGSARWTSIETSRALCPFLTDQVGSSYPTDFELRMGSAGSVEVRLTHDPAEGFGLFRGTLTGDAIAASFLGPFGGLSCPEDTSVTPETGGELHAIWDGRELSENYTEVYGSGPDAVTLHFEFRGVLTPR